MNMRMTQVFTLAEQLAGRRDPSLRRGIAQGAIEAVLGAVPYVCLYLVLADVFRGEISWARTAVVTAAMFGALALQIVIGMRSMINIMTSSYGLFGSTRLRLAEHIRHLPMGWFTNARSGALADVMTRRLDLLSEIWSHFIAYFAGGVAIPLCVGAFLMFVDWRLGLVTMATLPLAFALLRSALALLQRLTRGLLPVIDDANHAVVEYIRGIQVLRVYGRFGDGLSRLLHALARLRQSAIRIEVGPAPLVGSYGFTIDAGFAVLLYAGVWLWTTGELEPQTLLLFVVVSIKFFNPLFDLGVSMLLLRFGDEALRRTQDVFETPPLPEPTEGQQPTRFDIELDGVDFTYEPGAPAALEGVTAKLPACSLTAIVGPSGSGKSTLAHLVARLWDVGGGAIRIGGVDVRDMTTHELHRHVSMVFQDVVLFAGSVRDNILVGNPDATHEDVVRVAKAAQAHAFIEALPEGYDTVLGEGGQTLSGGERQRISIARALLKDAPVVLLDEATASIDPAGEVEIQRAIDALVRERTVVVIAHRLRTIQRAHQILVLDEGRLVERGTHDELLDHDGLYARLWQEQQRSQGWRRTPEPVPPSAPPSVPTVA